MFLRPLLIVSLVALAALLTGCNDKVKADASLEAPPPAKVEHELDANFVKVDHPDQFPLFTAVKYIAVQELNATGVVNPDVSRNVPAISLASGRVIEVDARLGDEVKKGQLLLKVRSSDISGAFSDYRKAVKNEQLAKIQLDRAKLLFDGGAIAKSALDVAQNAEENAKVDVETTEEHLKVLGSDPQHPEGIVDVYAPVSGVITDQQVTAGSGVQALSAPNPFTISDLSHVWIVCDVYENDLPLVRVGEFADIRLNAYPNRVFKGRIGNIGPILDPNIRTAKVRLEVENPGLMRIGMFVTATFHGETQTVHAAVPATAILHLHDRDWIYVPAEDAHFRRVEVTAGNTLPGDQQEIISGIEPGQQVVSNALVLQNTVEQ
jgi:cobalt-zinc-cadmium efflux system membrane fusion protein